LRTASQLHQYLVRLQLCVDLLLVDHCVNFNHFRHGLERVFREFLEPLALLFESLSFRNQVFDDYRGLLLVLLLEHFFHGFVKLASLGRDLDDLLLDLLVDFV